MGDASLKFSRHLIDKTSEYAWGLASDGDDTLWGAYTKSDGGISSRVFDLSSGDDDRLKDPDQKASFGPALAYHGGKLYMVYRQKDSNMVDDVYMHFAELDAAKTKWGEASTIAKMWGGLESKEHNGRARAKTDHSPSTCMLDGRLLVASKNSVKHFIAECWYDPSTTKRWDSNSNVTRYAEEKEEKKKRKKDWGYQATPAPSSKTDEIESNQILTEGDVGWNPVTPKSPSVAAVPGTVHMVYKGGYYDDDVASPIYYMTGNPDHEWVAPVRILGEKKTKRSPAVAVCGGRIVVVYADDDDYRLRYSIRSDGKTWSSPKSLSSENKSRFTLSKKQRKTNIVLACAGADRLAISFRRKSDDHSVIDLFDVEA